MDSPQPTPTGPPADPPSLGILGAGRAGTALARAAQSAGIPVRIAASRPPQSLRLHLAQYAPRATAVPAAEIARSPDSTSVGPGIPPIVVLMVPQEDLDTVDPDWLRGTVLVDATNRWAGEPLPAWFADALRQGRSSSEALALRFPGAKVVKGFNHISHWDLDTAGRGSGGQRRALAVAGDDVGAVRQVADLIWRLGFDPVVLPDLASGRALEPDGPVFNQPLPVDSLTRALDLDRP
jgi:predicted dinucleotide-binding enzyme